MINHVTFGQLEDAIEQYERSWTPRSRLTIASLLQQYKLTGDLTALTELIRVDIELRYEHDENVQLEDYFAEHCELMQDAASISQIAFEDFRSRLSRGLSVASTRWESLPGIHGEPWFQQLQWERSSYVQAATRSKHRSSANGATPNSEPAFLSALADCGFRIIRQIGSGALSRVYLAQQQTLAHRFVVLKVVDQSLAEPQHMAMLQHTNIVQIYSFHRILARSVICMPYAGSVTLEEYLQPLRKQNEQSSPRHASGQSLVATVRNRVKENETHVANAEVEDEFLSLVPAADESAVLKPLEQIESLSRDQLATWIFGRLASALAHSHARDVLHGDLKPANVLIRNDGEPALLDFNLSHSLSSGSSQHIGGTLPYMSPEAYGDLMRQKVTAKKASDIYSLGVMMFEFATGRLPYPTPRSEAAIDLKPAIDVRRGEPDWQQGDTVAPGLRAIINRCLLFDADARYPDAADLQEDIEREHWNLPLRHVSEPKLVRVSKLIRQNAGVLRLAGLLMAIGVCGAAIVYAMGMQSKNAQMTAMKRFESFAVQSAETLSMIMVDPNRHAGLGVEPAMKPLEEYGVLNGAGLKEFRWHGMTQEDQDVQRDTMLRHLVQVGFTETDRLLPDFERGLLTEADLQRLDQLIGAAERVCGETESRALLHLKARRATYAANTNVAEELTSRANGMQLTRDTEYYLEAVRLMSDRHWSEAAELLADLAKRSSLPSNLRWTMLARSQLNSGQYEDAKISITQSIERAPNAGRLWLFRGRAYFRMRMYERAIEDVNRSIELDKSHADSWQIRGVCKLALSDYEGALADFDEALRLAPGDVEYLLQRSRALTKLNRTVEAEQDFSNAMNAEALDYSAFLTRALARQDLEDYEGYLADLRKANELRPRDRSTLINIAKCLSMRLGRTEEAIQILDRVIELYPGDEAAHIDRAVLHAQLGQFDQADHDMEIAMSDPKKSLTFYQAACIYALKPEASDHQIAVKMLAHSLLVGFSISTKDIETDPDLKSLRELEGFKAIIQTHRLSNDKRLFARHSIAK